ncbi:MAG: hypothetical protein WCR20_17805, partial [Verrucomicrobiota bacterium]
KGSPRPAAGLGIWQVAAGCRNTANGMQSCTNDWVWSHRLILVGFQLNLELKLPTKIAKMI